MKWLQTYWWKVLCVVLIFYTFWAGLLNDVPRLPILNESIRNLYFHVPMWFAMVGLLFMAFLYSIKYLSSKNIEYDIKAKSYTEIGFFMGLIGISTGSVWARFTWGAWWIDDPKLHGAAIGILIYLAYFILRNSSNNQTLIARFAAVYSIFAFVNFIIFIFILPRLTASLHPGNGGNPAFSQYDLDNNMRLVFYPAVLGFLILGIWLSSLLHRIHILQKKYDEQSL